MACLISLGGSCVCDFRYENFQPLFSVYCSPELPPGVANYLLSLSIESPTFRSYKKPNLSLWQRNKVFISVNLFLFKSPAFPSVPPQGVISNACPSSAGPNDQQSYNPTKVYPAGTNELTGLTYRLYVRGYLLEYGCCPTKAHTTKSLPVDADNLPYPPCPQSIYTSHPPRPELGQSLHTTGGRSSQGGSCYL